MKKIGNNYVKIELKDKSLEGILVENKDKSKVLLKLKNGYNISLDKKDVKKINYVKKIKKEEKKSEKISFKKDLPTITILHTGGTISSRVDYDTGAVSPKFKPEEIIEMFPELKDIANIRSRLISNILSENMRFSNYNLIAKEIEKEVKNKVDGIIVTHGTDTLHYTSAALAFILEDLPIPVVLVGSQRSSDRGSSDAAVNLVSAILFITKTNFSGVSVCMHKSMNDDSCVVLPGTKTRKLHSSRRDAFKIVNGKEIADVDYLNKNTRIIDNDFIKRDGNRKLKLRLFKDVKVGILKTRPNMFAKEVDFYKNFDGLIIEGTGLGHMPISDSNENKKIFNSVKNLSKKMPVVMTSQTIFGRVQMNVYSVGRMLEEIGIIGNYCDMTTECAFIKLAWLLSNYKKDVRKLMVEDLRGEISKRSFVKEDFLE